MTDPKREVRRQMHEAVFTIQSLADFLQIDQKTVYRMAHAGELPGFKVRHQWRFKRADIDMWIESRKQTSGSGRSHRRRLPQSRDRARPGSGTATVNRGRK